VTVRRNRRAWLFAAGSAVLHLALIAILSSAKLDDSKPRSTEIELSIISEPAKTPAVAEDPAAVAANEPPPAEPVVPATPLPRNKRQTEVARPAHEVAPPESAPLPEAKASELAINAEGSSEPAQPSAAAPTTHWQPKHFDLSAHRAAASMIDDLEMPVRICNPRGVTNDQGACKPEDLAARAQRELDSSLRQAANAPAYRQKREPPELHRQGDGTYRYDGHVFSARIRDDGQVEFADGAAGLDGPSTIGIGVAGHFDLNDAIEGAMGKERYTAEKRWFLEQTVELRDKLAASARNRERFQARRLLERALERILSASELDAPHKRERVLGLWEDCGDDAEAADTRRIVEVFVRTRMPEGSDLGFTKSELERFNRGRSGATAFNPYRG
jgi:outer membrane biosynthesis protein TonB